MCVLFVVDLCFYVFAPCFVWKPRLQINFPVRDNKNTSNLEPFHFLKCGKVPSSCAEEGWWSAILDALLVDKMQLRAWWLFACWCSTAYNNCPLCYLHPRPSNILSPSVFCTTWRKIRVAVREHSVLVVPLVLWNLEKTPELPFSNLWPPADWMFKY